METVVVFSELEELLAYAKSRGSSLRDQFEDLKRSFEQVVESNALLGATKIGINSVMRNQYIPVAKAFIETYHVIEEEVSGLTQALRDHLDEHASNGIICESIFDEAESTFSANYDENVSREDALDRIYTSINDLVELPSASRTEFNNEHEELMSDTTQLRERLNDFDFTPAELETMLGELDREIGNLQSVMGRSFEDPDRLDQRRNSGFREWMADRAAEREFTLSGREFMENFRGPLTAYGVEFGLMCEDFIDDIWAEWETIGGTMSFQAFLDTIDEPQRSQFLWLKGFTTSLAAIAGDPVNMSTGNFLYDHTDVIIDGAYPLVFRRFYNSLDSHQKDLGKNWCHNYQIDLTVTKDGRVAVMYEDGHLEFYRPNDEGTYYAQAGVFTELVKYPGNETALNEVDKLERYELTFLDGRVYHFNVFGLLTKQVGSGNNETVLTYDGRKLIKVENPSGHLAFSHTEDGLIESITDHSGRRITYGYERGSLTSFKDFDENEMKHIYDQKDRLVKVVNREGHPSFDQVYDEKDRASEQKFVDGGSMRYEYDEDNNETVFTWQNGTEMTYKRNEKYLTTGIAYPDGEEKVEFNDSNQRTSFTDKLGNRTEFEYDGVGNISKVTNALGIVTEVEYKENTDKMMSLIVAGSKKVGMSYNESNKISYSEDALGNKTTFTYNKEGLPTTVAQPDGSKIRVLYDEKCNITQLTNATGVVSGYEYDSLNRVVATIDGNKNRTEFSYDSLDNMVQVKKADGSIQNFEYNNNNKITQMTDFNGAITKREYNNLGKVAKVIDPLGRETNLAYDSLWNVNEVIQPNGAHTKFLYNAMNRLEVIVKPDGNTIQYDYDAVGNRTKIIDDEGNITSFSYDALGQLIGVIDAEGNKTSYAYDSEGRVVSVTDALDNVMTLEYDAFGQLIKETNALGDSRTYTYTSIGKIETITDEVGRITNFDYALGGVLSGARYPDGTHEAYEYDGVGNVKTHTNTLGQITEYTYDCLNRAVLIKTNDWIKLYTYDSVGNVISMTDELGNKTNYEYTITGKLAKVADALGNETHYSYDQLDQLIEIRQEGTEILGHDGVLDDVQKMNEENHGLRVTKYHRNIMGQIESVEDALGNVEQYKYSPKGQLIEKVDKDGYLTKFGYTARGDIAQIQYADGKAVEMSYNALRQLTEVKDWLGSMQIEVNPLGRATKVTDYNGNNISYEYGKSGERTGIVYPDGMKVSYEYDDVLRLTQVDDGNQQINYRYDNFNRLISKQFDSGVNTKYDYNYLGQLSELTHLNGDDVLDHYKYSYDLMGNKTQIEKQRNGIVEDSGIFSYAYDEMNRLQAVIKDGNPLRNYGYDCFGNRTSMMENGNEITYNYNSLNQLVSSSDGTNYGYDGRGNLVETFKNDQPIHRYEFGALNRLEKTFNFEENVGATYAYNGVGHRVSRTQGTSLEPVLPTAGLDNMMLNPTKQVDDVLDLTRQYNNLLERKENGNGISYIYDWGVISASSKDQNLNYLCDDLGSPVRLMHDSATELDVLGYDESGNSMTHYAPETPNPFGFTGYQLDPVANNLLSPTRVYNPEMGRFISQDAHWDPSNMIYGDKSTFSGLPSRLRGLAPDPLAIGQSGNLYAYTMNNPVNSLDLSGNFIISGLIRGVSNLTTQVREDGWSNVSWGEVAGEAGRGALTGSIPIIGTIHNIYHGATIVGNVFYNDCRETINDSQGGLFIGNYRGQTVIRSNLFGLMGDGSGMSAGPFMFLGRNADEETFLHEHGHHRDYRVLGFWGYYLGIGLPSFQNANRRRSSIHNWRNFHDEYSGQRWEINAEIFGGVVSLGDDGNTIFSNEEILNGAAYFTYLYSLSGVRDFWGLISNVGNFSRHDFSAINKEG